MVNRGGSNTKPQRGSNKPQKTGNARRGNANAQQQARKANNQFGKDLNKQILKLPWVENPNKKKPSSTFTRGHDVTTFAGHTIRPNTAHAQSYTERQGSYTLAETGRNLSQRDTSLTQLGNTGPLTIAPYDSENPDATVYSPTDLLKYDPLTGTSRALTEVAPILEKTKDEGIPSEIEDAYNRGMMMERGAYSVGKSEDYFKKLYENNYYDELIYNPETQQYESVPVLKPNAEMPDITIGADFLGNYIDTWTYKKKGILYLKPGAPEMPVEFDDEGNITKVKYNNAVIKDDGSWDYLSTTDTQQYKDDWAVYCALRNAAVIPSRELTERMRYTAGWDEEATDSVMDLGRDALGSIISSGKKDYDITNPQDAANHMFADHTIRMFKNAGGYLKTYLFTPLRKGDTQTAVINGLVNLAETCDYAGVGTRALFAPQLGIEYEEGDNALTRLGKAYTTHNNYEPDSGSMAKDMATWIFTDPSIYLTLGLAGVAKGATRLASKTALKPLRENIIKYGSESLYDAYKAPLIKEYKSIARDITTADARVLEKHAERVAEILRDSGYGGTHYGIANEVMNELRGIQNQKNFLFVRAAADSSEVINKIDTFFLAGGLYLPYSAIKTIKGTRSLIRNNQRVAKHLTKSAFDKYQNAQRLFKDYTGSGSIMDFHHVIDGLRSMKTLDDTDSFKSILFQKDRRQYLQQQRRLISAVNRFKNTAERSFSPLAPGYTQRLGQLYDDISIIFKNLDDGSSPKTLDELEETLNKMSGKSSDMNSTCNDIFDNMLKVVRDAKEAVELAKKTDAESWLTAISRAASSKEVQDLYAQYLSKNSQHAVKQIEELAVDRYKWLYADEHGIDKDLIDVPDDMVLINASTSNDLDSVPLTKSGIENVAANDDYKVIPHYLGDAPEATQNAVKNIKKSLDDLVAKDELGNPLRNRNGSVKLKVNNYYTTRLYNYLSAIPDNKLSRTSLSELIDTVGKSLDSLKGAFGTDIKGLPDAEVLAKFLDGAEDAEKNLFIYSGGPELMQKLYDAGALDYYKLCRTKDSVVNYLPPKIETARYRGGTPKLVVSERRGVLNPSKKLREARLAHEEAQLAGEEYREAYRAMAADPNGVAQRKLELRHKLRTTVIEKDNGVVTTAMDEYQTLVKDLKKFLGDKESTAGLINSLDIAFSDLIEVSALTAAQAEKIVEVNMAMSTFLSKSLNNPVIMDAVRKFDVDGPYGFLLEYKDDIYNFLKDNVESGRDVPFIDRLYQSIDSIETWRDSLDAYFNFQKSISALNLSERETTAVLEYCLGKNPDYLLNMSRNMGYLVDNMEAGIGRILGSDNLLIDSYRETVLRTSFLDEKAWLPNHFDHVKSCEKEIAELSKSDVKLQMLQAIELDSNAIRRFNKIAKERDVYFLKTVTDGKLPDSPVTRVEMQKWVPVDEDIELPELLKVLQDSDNSYSHVFEVSEKFTEKEAIEQVVDVLDKSVKSGPNVKHVSVPTLVTHGRDAFDIDVLRQCCLRNNTVSAALSNTNALFKNRINTFKELMLKDKNHVCIDPDKIPKIADALSSLSRDLPQDVKYGIFNISGFSRDIDSLFNTLYDPAFIHEVSEIYDCEHPLVKSIMEAQEEVKALRVGDYDEALLSNQIVDKLEKLDALRAEEEVFSGYENPISEGILEEQERIMSLPIDDEEKARRIEAIPEKVIANFEEQYSLPVPKYFGTLDHVTAGLQSIKRAVSDIYDFSRDAYYTLSSGGPVIEFSGGKFRDFYQGTTKRIPNVKKIVKELDNTFIPGTDTSLSSLLSDSLKSDLVSFTDKQLDEFGWDLNADFTNKTSVANNISVSSDVLDSLDELLLRLQSEFDAIKKNPSLSKYEIKAPAKPVNYRYKEGVGAVKVEDVVPESTIGISRVAEEDLTILPETHALQEELKPFVDNLDISIKGELEFGMQRGSTLAKFDNLKELVEKYKYSVDIPEAVTNNLIVLSRVVDSLDSFNVTEYKEFVRILNSYVDGIDKMLSDMVKLDSGFDFASHVDSVFIEFNQKSALLQQDLLRLQNNVTNRTFKESLNITESSPFIRDVFSPALDKLQGPTTGDMCKTVRDEVNKLNHIRSAQTSSCLTTKEFEGFGDYASFGFPMGTSAQLKFDATGQAFTVRKAYDIENASRYFDLSLTRKGTDITEFVSKKERIHETVGLIDNINNMNDSIKTLTGIMDKYKAQLGDLERIKKLEVERVDIANRIEEEGFMLPKEYDEAIDGLTADINKATDNIKDLKAERKDVLYDMKNTEDGLLHPASYEQRLDEIDIELQKLNKSIKASKKYKIKVVAERDLFTKKYGSQIKRIDNEIAQLKKEKNSIRYAEYIVTRSEQNIKNLKQQLQDSYKKLLQNYEWLKHLESADGVTHTKAQRRILMEDIQHVIEDSDVFLRFPVEVSTIPAHELMSLNRFANKIRNAQDFKLKSSDYLKEISTLDDWNRIINQTKKLAASLDVSSPYHYLVYLSEAQNVEEGFLIADELYNMFYKHVDTIKQTGMRNVDKGLINVPIAYKETVANIMESGFDSIKFDANPDILKLLQGDGLDLIYKKHPRTYFDTVYHKSKITGNHSTTSNIADILYTAKVREGWAEKFASSAGSVRDKVFAELENSQVELLKILRSVSGTPYEKSCRLYLDNLQNGIYKAQTLQVMDFITKDADHLITELLYHNHTLVLPLRYSSDFAEYGKYLTKLKNILDEKPMFINAKQQGEHLWISLDKDANPRIINDTKHIKEDTKFELNGKTYDPSELNAHYQHNGLPDEVELTEDMLKDIDSEEALRGYCERLRDYIRTSYAKIDFLTNGAIKGSAITPYGLTKHHALRKAAPVDWLANTIRGSITCDQRLFHTSQFDFSIIGENEFRFKLGGMYDDADILQNIKYVYDDLAGTVSTERMYIANYFDESSHCKLNNLFGNEYSDKDIVQILKNSPEQCVLVLREDSNTMTGFRVDKMRITDELSIKQARASNAVVADYETYVEMTRLLNNSEFDKVWMKTWAKIVFFLKVGHLCNPGTWARNWMDATIKATSATGALGKTAIDQVRAMKHLIDYNKIVKEVRDTYGIHHNTSKRLANEWDAICLRAGQNITITKDQFDFLESWLKVSLSGGESHMLREMFKKMKYDPWRSANLKPGNSFTSSGRKAMQEEFDYIGSDLFRFEQIGEDEIKRLIEEGSLKGENMFADDFSIEEFWEIFNKRKNPKTSYIEDTELFNKYSETAKNIIMQRNNNLFRGNRGLGSKVDYMCSMFLKPMSMVEQVVRLGQFMTLEKEGFTRSEIFKSIADTQFEYELKSSRIKGAELFMTYFNFEYNNIRYWCNMLEDQPEFLFALEQIWDDFSWEASQQAYEDEDMYQNRSILYMMANGALPIGSSGLYLKMYPSALGALNWFYGMPSQYMNSVVPPVEYVSKEFLNNMGGDYAEWMSNMDYGYADEKEWQKMLSMVPIVGTMYTRYYQHFTERQPWTRLDEGTLGEKLAKYNPSVFGAIYQYNKPHEDDFESFQKKLAKQGKWYDCNINRVVSIEKKNNIGLNNSNLSFDERRKYMLMYQNKAWDNNWGGFVEYGHWEAPGKVFFDENGNAKELGLNRYRNLSIPGEWESLCDDMYKYHGRKWDANSESFIPFWLWKEEKLNRKDLSWEERCEYMAEKGKYWDAEDHKFKSAPFDMHEYNKGYYHRGWRNFKRWINYGNKPPATKYDNKWYNPGTTFKVGNKPFSKGYNYHEDNAALRMAISGQKAYDEYYKFEYQYNYRYRSPNPLNQLRRYNPIIRYHIMLK